MECPTIYTILLYYDSSHCQGSIEFLCLSFFIIPEKHKYCLLKYF